MAIGAQRTNSDPRAEANHYIKGTRRGGKSLKNASSQLKDFDLMAVLQRTINPRVVAEHQMTTYLQATSV